MLPLWKHAAPRGKVRRFMALRGLAQAEPPRRLQRSPEAANPNSGTVGETIRVVVLSGLEVKANAEHAGTGSVQERGQSWVGPEKSPKKQ